MAETIATSPTGAERVVFEPREKYLWVTTDDEGVPTLRGIYKPGLTYTVREGDAALEQKLEEWLAEGKARIVSDRRA